MRAEDPVLDVNVNLSLKQTLNNVDMALLGGEVQGRAATLYTLHIPRRHQQY
jgi:hypothetical protein